MAGKLKSVKIRTSVFVYYSGVLCVACLTCLTCPLRSVHAAEFKAPLAVAATGGTVYVADRELPGIWKVTDGKPEVYFAASKKFRTPLNAVRCLAIDEKGRLLAGDSATRDVYRFDADGKPTPLTGGKIGIPMGIAVDSKGNLFVSDLETHHILKIPSAGGKPVKFAEVAAPRGLTVDSEDRVWVVSHGKDQLVRISSDGKTEVVVKGRPFRFPHDVANGEQGVAYVSDGYSKTIWKVGADGKTEKWSTEKPLQNPVGMTRSGGKLFVADPHAKQVFELADDGTVKALLSVAAPEKK